MEIRGVNGVGGINNDRINKLNEKVTTHQAGSDDVQISDEAKKLSEISAFQQIVESAPDVREDKIAEVKAKLESGAYDNEEVMNSVAEKLMKVLGL